MYPAELVKPMREHLTQVGFEELYSAEAVDNALAKQGTTLIVVNSVCGCCCCQCTPRGYTKFTKRKTPNTNSNRFCWR